VIGPYPRPITIGARASDTIAVLARAVPAAIVNAPATHRSTHTCETRMAPWRSMNMPDTRLATIDPA
jgi:hypothetical protein